MHLQLIYDDINPLLQSLQLFCSLNEEDLKNISEIVKKSIYENIWGGKDIYGNAVKGKQKPSYYGGNRIFVHTGLMAYQGVISERVSANEYNVTMINERQDAAYYLNSGTKFMPPREFFGISDKTMEQIEKYILNKINKTNGN